MKSMRSAITECRVHLGAIADVLSGVFLKPSPAGDIAYLQVKDLTMFPQVSPSTRVEYTPKLGDLLLRKGDLLFVGKGSKYLCRQFDLEISAVPSTAFYILRPTGGDVLPEYLCWFLNHPVTIAAVKTIQAGSSTPLIHKPALESMEIIVPDLDTQHRVVALSKLQQREKQLLESIAEKKVQVTDQLLFNEIIKKSTI